VSALAAWLRSQYGFGPRFARDAITLAREGLTEFSTPPGKITTSKERTQS
jgi:hypothetical protein